MGGSMPFHEALALRLSAMKPSKAQLYDMLEKEPLHLTPGVADLISTLHANVRCPHPISPFCSSLYWPRAVLHNRPVFHSLRVLLRAR